MKLTYSISLEDWTAAQVHHLENWPGFHEAIWFWRWTVALGFGAVVVLVTSDWSTWARGALGLSVALMLYVWYPRYVKNRHRTRVSEQMNAKEMQPFLESKWVVEVRDDGLWIEGVTGEHLIKWTFVKAVDDTPRHLFIRFRYGLGLPIPKTCMSPAEKDLLVCGIRARIAPSPNPALNPPGTGAPAG
jgi:hypothetical protein